MRKRLLMTCGVLGAAAMMALLPFEAAAGSGADPGPIPSTKSVSAHDMARAVAKDQLARELTLLHQGAISGAKFSYDVQRFLVIWGKATFVSPRLIAATDPPTADYLSVQQYPETNPSNMCKPGYSCYCGPASATSVLQYLQPQSHDYLAGKASNEELPPYGSYSAGEYGLAGNYGSGYPYSLKYLETDYRGGETPWYSGGGDWPMSQSFNYWISGSYSGFPYYANHPPTSLSDYESDLVADIYAGGSANSSGYPLAGDVEEVQYQLHLPGHPSNIEIEHWIAMFGYSSNGAGTDYVDPVAGSALNGNYGFNVSAYNYGYSSNNIYILVTDAGPNGGPYGIVW